MSNANANDPEGVDPSTASGAPVVQGDAMIENTGAVESTSTLPEGATGTVQQSVETTSGASMDVAAERVTVERNTPASSPPPAASGLVLVLVLLVIALLLFIVLSASRRRQPRFIQPYFPQQGFFY